MDLVKALGDGLEEPMTGWRQLNGAVQPPEQLNSCLLLKRCYLPADCALSEAQLIGGNSEAQMTRNRFESAEQIEGREPIFLHGFGLTFPVLLLLTT